MIPVLIKKLKGNSKTKTKSKDPFWGILAVVWSILNWELLYSIPLHDKGTPLASKVEFINNHFIDHPFFITLFKSILYTFIILIIGFLLKGISKLIVNLYDKKLIPLFYKWSDTSSIVLKTDLQKSEKEKLELVKKNDEQNVEIIKLKGEYSKLEKKYYDNLLEKD